MKRTHRQAIAAFGILCLAAGNVRAQPAPADQPGTAGTPASSAKLTVTLVDLDRNAAKRSAVIKTDVTGIELTDPAAVNEQPRDGQGHIHYQVDDGPVIATTATKLAFHELSPGVHAFTVMLAANDHSPLGPQETMRITIP